MDKDTLVEQLADHEHASWSHWMKYLFSRCTENPDDGSMTIPPALVAQWHRQAETAYSDLTEKEKYAKATSGGNGIKTRSTSFVETTDADNCPAPPRRGSLSRNI